MIEKWPCLFQIYPAMVVPDWLSGANVYILLYFWCRHVFFPINLGENRCIKKKWLIVLFFCIILHHDGGVLFCFSAISWMCHLIHQKHVWFCRVGICEDFQFVLNKTHIRCKPTGALAIWHFHDHLFWLSLIID